MSRGPQPPGAGGAPHNEPPGGPPTAPPPPGWWPRGGRPPTIASHVALDQQHATADAGAGEGADGSQEHKRRLALNTVIFSIATGMSRVAGLVREIVAASYFGVTGAMSAFTIAFQVPNL